MMIFNVFGRLLGVTLPERKYAPSCDIVLPAELREEEIAGYLGDIYHEAATPQRPEVFRVE
ncbi:TPA: hypothetical protein SMG11_001960 [Serratia marcescens]|uniref:DUF7661 family protein n=1 Tax=Serratia marcescens TaxID=615 RepID=UPI0018D333BE|nr:hypothetical protein [Serratia marcescens]MBH1895521.1 hypothetical protein [Serratia marcescens]MBH2690954.1 hypothetical protein [Serratia marcescens]MBH2738848.1 hypothetical protein [Serratia marcescens]MBH2831858.1 hypothetical protein [Serratia marcescens]MBH3222285.1 hypothetical protein [Serratia marcescens]